MITLIHGENVNAARARLSQLIKSYKDRNYEVVRVDPSREIEPQLTENSLFSGSVVFIIENPKKLPTKFKMNGEVVLLCDKAAPATLTKLLPKETKIEKFDLPKKLFSFLETIYPGNAKNVLTMLHELISTEPTELVFFMICRQFRDLYWVLLDEKSMGLPDWRASKLKTQATRFNPNKLKDMITSLAQIDYKAKTGEVDLITSLDLLIARDLK